MSTGAPARVAIENDYSIVVAGLAAMLQPFADQVEVVATETCGEAPTDVDIVLFDTHGASAASERAVYERIARTSAKLVVLSWALDLRSVQRALRSGATAYLSKTLEPKELADALELVHAGQTVLPDSKHLARTVAHVAATPGLALLTARELEIVELIALGLSNQEIAARLFLSINSVKTYIRTSYQKMGVNTRSQAVLWGINQGLGVDAVRSARTQRAEGSPGSLGSSSGDRQPQPVDRKGRDPRQVDPQR